MCLSFCCRVVSGSLKTQRRKGRRFYGFRKGRKQKLTKKMSALAFSGCLIR
ncbi:hypothetical protein GCWU000324_02853 [Kingella oralis ATCC 51147]|uniref:Uncharacterized protein n=1 Tax=Kingella oralis ATCC 51147 TaxID=629741 RepID=C4GMC0_9NEIS|nr:hypothetical protein GCWU000324_02853 [Kingella oralis ATCC 51147]